MVTLAAADRLGGLLTTARTPAIAANSCRRRRPSVAGAVPGARGPGFGSTGAAFRLSPAQTRSGLDGCGRLQAVGFRLLGEEAATVGLAGLLLVVRAAVAGPEAGLRARVATAGPLATPIKGSPTSVSPCVGLCGTVRLSTRRVIRLAPVAGVVERGKALVVGSWTVTRLCLT